MGFICLMLNGSSTVGYDKGQKGVWFGFFCRCTLCGCASRLLCYDTGPSTSHDVLHDALTYKKTSLLLACLLTLEYILQTAGQVGPQNVQ